MAKLVKTYENGTEKFELTLLGETYNFTMIPDSYGMSGDKPGFDTQIPKAHPEYEDFDDYDDLLDILDELYCEEGGSDLAKLIQELTDWEKAHE